MKIRTPLYITLIASFFLSCSDNKKSVSKDNKVSAASNEDETLKTNIPPKTVYLFLHGLMSNAATWDVVTDRLFDDQCPVVEDGLEYKDLSQSTCFRYTFLTRVDSDYNTWTQGDGATYQQLGEEVKDVVKVVKNATNATSMVIVGHSRGGLAARAYLQEVNEDESLKFALLTIGTPHFGSPFGRMKHWFESEGMTADYIKLEQLKFIMSPSVGFLASSLDEDGPVRNDVSRAIWDLAENVKNLDKNVKQFGQVYSSGIPLGSSLVLGFDMFADSALNPLKALPGDFSQMKDYIFANVEGDWLDSDGIVPVSAAKFTDIPGFQAQAGQIFSKELKEVRHADVVQVESNIDDNPNDGLTGQIDVIRDMLEKLTAGSEFVSFKN